MSNYVENDAAIAVNHGRPMLSRGAVWLMAVACGITVANLYYSQPLLVAMGNDFGVSDRQMGIVSALTQIGYALGLFLFVPLGDMLERRRLILLMLGAVTCTLVAVAVSPGIIWLSVASLALGAATVTPQVIVPMAAGLADPDERGQIVGKVMSGLLIGILLSRTLSGFVGDWFGWRSIYWIAAGLSVVLAAVLRVQLPENRPIAKLSYPQLLRSLGKIAVDEPILRESCVFGAVTFGAFSVFWTTLAFFVARPPYGFSSDVVGLFGLAGAAGASIAPVAGRLADVKGPRLTIGIALVIVLLSFGVLVTTGYQLWGLIVGVILLDLGAQSNQISNQARIYSLAPETHNRLNTIYMVTFFIGGAAGSALGAYAWSQWAWNGVCAVGAGLTLLGLAWYVATVRRPR